VLVSTIDKLELINGANNGLLEVEQDYTIIVNW